MHFFNNDYSEACAPEVLARIQAENLNPKIGYGSDTHSQTAATLIRNLLGDAGQSAAVHFLVGGTQANMVLISAVLKPYEAVIAVDTAHINVHEAGAIEGQGHKILTAEDPEGKLNPAAITRIVREHSDESMVKPRLVYLSQSTELGTVYSLAELEAIRACCDDLDLFLYVDGARLGAALTAQHADMNLADLARLCDAFTIGGTKNGLLFGEALILLNPKWQPEFRYTIKHYGAMLAKGFLSGLQFEVLFEDGLFFRLAEHTNRQAAKIATAMQELGIEFYVEPISNQLFPILSTRTIEALRVDFVFSLQKSLSDDRSVVRLVSSWATPDESVSALIDRLRSLSQEEATL